MKVTVKTPQEGQTIVKGIIAINPNKKDYGSIMVQTETFSLDAKNGFMNKKKRVAFIPGELETLVSLVDAFGLVSECDYSEKTGIEHSIVIKEQTEPFYPDQSPKTTGGDNPRELVSEEGGKPIYRKSFLIPEGTDTDVLVKHVPVSGNSTITTGGIPSEMVNREFKTE